MPREAASSPSWGTRSWPYWARPALDSTSNRRSTVADMAWAPCRSGDELLGQDALLQAVLRIEQDVELDPPGLGDRHVDHLAHLGVVGHRAHRALVGVHDLQP